MGVEEPDDGWMVRHYVHVVPVAHLDDHDPSPLCPCGPAIEEFDHETPSGVKGTSYAVYHHDPRRGLRAVPRHVSAESLTW